MTDITMHPFESVLIRTLEAEITTLRAEVERLTAENASLASWQCEFTDGKTGLVYAEGGGTYCAMAKKMEKLREALLDAEKESKYSFFEAHLDKLGDANRALRAEVERLAREKAITADVAAQQNELALEYLTDCNTLVSENEKLRAALGDIHAAAGDNNLVANIARAALAGAEKEETTAISTAMVLKIDEKQFLAAVDREGDHEIGVGKFPTKEDSHE